MSTPTSARASATSTATVAGGWLTPAELVALGAIWGASFLFMRVAAKDFGPFALVEVRLGLGAIILLPFLWRARSQLGPALWLRLTAIAAINTAIPFVLFAWAAERAPAGVGAITNALAVPFTALVAFALFGEQIGLRRALGFVLGFTGVIVLASGRSGGGRHVAGHVRGRRRRHSVTESAATCKAVSQGRSGERCRVGHVNHLDRVGRAAEHHHLAAARDSVRRRGSALRCLECCAPGSRTFCTTASSIVSARRARPRSRTSFRYSASSGRGCFSAKH